VVFRVVVVVGDEVEEWEPLIVIPPKLFVVVLPSSEGRLDRMVGTDESVLVTGLVKFDNVLVKFGSVDEGFVKALVTALVVLPRVLGRPDVKFDTV
jgi:hypothetical protein